MSYKVMLQAREENLLREYQGVWNLIVLCGSSPSQLWLKHPVLLNCASHYPNIAKLFTYSSITIYLG